jgi:pilus assembly protein Flp/PilA
MKNFIHRFIHEESGQDLVEYALVAALVGLGAVASLNSLASSVTNTFNAVGNTLTTATS